MPFPSKQPLKNHEGLDPSLAFVKLSLGKYLFFKRLNTNWFSPRMILHVG
ncbi:hypothetical protein Syun_014431 [Stephania yunnanensis]|uniref:Uncharacterized protein n=1 Tax=Stephania yunnanensis TaxID=152371 RepID=A0AAP0PBW6_9MAGN